MASEATASARSGRAPRAQTAIRFLLASLGLRATGFALALGAVAVGASVAATALNLRADLTPKMNRELRSYGPNLLVTPHVASASVATRQRMAGIAVDSIIEALEGKTPEHCVNVDAVRAGSERPS